MSWVWVGVVAVGAASLVGSWIILSSARPDSRLLWSWALPPAVLWPAAILRLVGFIGVMGGAMGFNSDFGHFWPGLLLLLAGFVPSVVVLAAHNVRRRRRSTSTSQRAL